MDRIKDIKLLFEKKNYNDALNLFQKLKVKYKHSPNLSKYLDEIEKSVLEHTLAIHDKEELTAGQIAKKLNISRSKVSRIRGKIDEMLRERGI